MHGRAGAVGVELDALKALWELGPGTVREVRGRLAERGRDWAHTTVLTLLVRLMEKGLVQRSERGVKHVYRAALSRDELIGRRLEQLSRELCDGARSPLVAALVDPAELEDEDVRALQAVLARIEQRRTAQRSPGRGAAGNRRPSRR